MVDLGSSSQEILYSKKVYIVLQPLLVQPYLTPLVPVVKQYAIPMHTDRYNPHSFTTLIDISIANSFPRDITGHDRPF